MLHVDRCRDMDELINFSFEPDPDHTPDAGTGFLPPISYRLRNFAALPSWRISRPIWRISHPFPYQFAPNSHAVF